MTRPVVYIAHQLAGNRRKNRREALAWASWAGKLGLAPSATWIALAEVCDEETGRALGLEIDKALVERCDYLFLCGPRVSGGMEEEEKHARAHGVPVVDLTRLDFRHAESLLRTMGILE